jgi:hypothetical protein
LKIHPLSTLVENEDDDDEDEVEDETMRVKMKTMMRVRMSSGALIQWLAEAIACLLTKVT